MKKTLCAVLLMIGSVSAFAGTTCEISKSKIEIDYLTLVPFECAGDQANETFNLIVKKFPDALRLTYSYGPVYIRPDYLLHIKNLLLTQGFRVQTCVSADSVTYFKP